MTSASACQIGNENPFTKTAQPRRPVMVRIPPGLLVRIDVAARRLGLSRAAFMLSSTVRELERMEG